MDFETEIKNILVELRKAIDGIKNDVAGSQEKYKELSAKLESFEKLKTEKNNPTLKLPGVENEAKKFSYCKAIRAALSGNWKDAEFEHEVHKQTANNPMNQYAMSIGDDSKGGFLVPEEISSELIDLAMPQIVAERLGVQIIRDAQGSPLKFKRVTSRPTASWVAENSAVTASDAGTGMLTLRHRSLRALTDVSNWLVMMPSVGAEAMIRRLISQAHALALDLAIIQGKGNENEPQGIKNTPNVNELDLGTNGDTPELNDLFDAMLLVENNDFENTGWAFHPRTWNTLRKIKDGESNYILDQNSRLLNGIPFAKSTQIPITETHGSSSVASTIYGGDFSQVIAAMWGGMRFLVSNVSDQALENDQTRIATTQIVDVGVKQPTALFKITGVLA